MGQKVHPEIFKLSKTSGWKSKYIENKEKNLGLHARKDLEIRTFIKHFFTEIGLNTHRCKISYFNRQLNIQINYTKNDKILVNSDPEVQILFVDDPEKIISNKKSRFIKKSIALKIKKLFFLLFLYNVTSLPRQNRELNTPEFFSENRLLYANKNLGGINSIKIPLKRALLLTLRSLTLLSKVVKINKGLLHKNENLCTYKFTTLFFKSFVSFFKKPIKMTLIFRAFNKGLGKVNPKITKNTIKKKVLLLRKYKRNGFFKKGLNLMLLLTSQKESANTIASYATSTLRNFKKHKLFFKFLKKSLYLFAKNKKTVIKALKVQLKGRINGADRARRYIIRIGNRLSLLTTSSRINYSESTAFTPDGTLSVKVWVTYHKPWAQFKSNRHLHKIKYENLPTKKQVQKNKKR